MTTDSFIALFLSALIVVLINLFIHRDKTYIVFVKNVDNNKVFKVIVKALNKKKAYEVVSKYFMEGKIPFVIGDLTNTIYLDNNSVICTDIFISIKK